MSFSTDVCSHPPWPTRGHETMVATLKVSINHPQWRFAFLKDFFRWCKCMTNFIFKSHLVWNVSSNGHWNDKFHKAKKPVAIIHLLRSVKYALKLLKLTAPPDKTRSEWASNLSKPPIGTFSACNSGSNISKCFDLLYSLNIHNIYQSQLRPCVFLFLAMRVGFVVTDGGFVWWGSWRVTPQRAPVQEWTCCSLCYAFWWVWH